MNDDEVDCPHCFHFGAEARARCQLCHGTRKVARLVRVLYLTGQTRFVTDPPPDLRNGKD